MRAEPIAATCYTGIYPGRADQLHHVRRAVARHLAGCPAADDATLILSELAANAIVHSASRGQFFTVRAELLPRLRLGRSRRPRRPLAPQAGRRPPARPGRGRSAHRPGRLGRRDHHRRRPGRLGPPRPAAGGVNQHVTAYRSNPLHHQHILNNKRGNRSQTFPHDNIYQRRDRSKLLRPTRARHTKARHARHRTADARHRPTYERPSQLSPGASRS